MHEKTSIAHAKYGTAQGQCARTCGRIPDRVMLRMVIQLQVQRGLFESGYRGYWSNGGGGRR